MREVRFKDAGGEAVIRFLSPQLLATEVTGAASKEFVLLYIREFHAFLDRATRKFDVCHDWGKVTSVGPDVRSTYSSWAEQRRDRMPRSCRGVHILVESTITYLALEAGSMFARDYMHVYRSRTVFEQERALLLRTPSRAPIDRGAGPL